MKKLLDELQTLQKETINIVRSVAEEDYHQQFHPDLSPIGWHLGHSVYTESYWIREQLLGKQAIDDSLKSLYVPELSNKQSRGSALPDKQKLIKWANVIQSENRASLESAIINKTSHKLLENNYLLHFLIQHYSQHIETMHMVLTESQLQQLNTEFANAEKLNPCKPIPKNKIIAAGIYNIGADEKKVAYDNEQPAHSIKLNDFKISTLPVSNSEYLKFIIEGAYSARQYWSDEGWKWINKTQYRHPHHWRQHNENGWFGINHEGAYILEATDPVHGLNHYEASAYAQWAGGRLPHEHEWEIASKNNFLQRTAHVWEWCDNVFHPYPEFKPYPYEGYSVPYFDKKHYVLRGGSNYTKKVIRRSSFRNYYTADKRHIFAGMRLVYD
jgi:ergothioneine biosynthesis protein EgtB